MIRTVRTGDAGAQSARIHDAVLNAGSMQTISKAGAVLGTLLVSLAMAAGPVSAAPMASESAHAVRAEVNVVGRWAEERPNRQGITRYIEHLTFSADGHLTLMFNYECRARLCPVFKLAPINGTYRSDGKQLDLTLGNGAQYTGRLRQGALMLTSDDDAHHRLERQDATAG